MNGMKGEEKRNVFRVILLFPFRTDNHGILFQRGAVHPVPPLIVILLPIFLGISWSVCPHTITTVLSFSDMIA